jgi:hypothetical protein
MANAAVFPTAWSEKKSDALAKLIVARERILGGSSAAFPHARTAALSGIFCGIPARPNCRLIGQPHLPNEQAGA